MKQTDLFRLSLFFFFCVVFAACNDNEEKQQPLSLHLDVSSCEVMLDGSTTIGLIANEDVTLTIQNPAVAEASYNYVNLEGKASSITISGKRKGHTTISVTDNRTQETVQLSVEVIDKYLTYSIKDSDHPDLKTGVTLFLINNDNRDCYFSRLDKLTHKQTAFAQGTYSFWVDKNDGESVPFLTLTYGFKDSGDITNALPRPALHKFDIRDSNSNTLSMIQRVLGVDWNYMNEKAMVRDYNVTLSMNMKESGTDYVVKGVLDFFTKIPEGVMPHTLFTAEVTSSQCAIYGDKMALEDKAELEKEMLASVKAYRFMYTGNQEGKAYIYKNSLDDAECNVYDFKTKGEITVEMGPVLIPVQIQSWFVLTAQDEKLVLFVTDAVPSITNRNGIRSVGPMNFSYFLDVTTRYKTKYPALEKAYIIQKLSLL